MGHLRKMVVLAITVILVVGIGCEKGSDKAEKKSAESFRVPDSLLSPKDRYRLVLDEYHPIKGGVMANKDISLNYPASEISDFISRKVFGIAFDSYKMIEEKVGRPAQGRVVCIGAKDMDEYKFLTRKEWWYYGTIKGDTIYFEPYDIMLKRMDKESKQTIAQMAFIQKFAQMALREKSNGKIPCWLRESTASYFAGEKFVLKAQAAQFREDYIDFKPTVDELNNYLEVAQGMPLTRVSFYIAYQMFDNLRDLSSIDKILNFTEELGKGKSLDEASVGVFGMNYKALIKKISDYKAVPEEGWKM
jgi:hypothetical protein